MAVKEEIVAALRDEADRLSQSVGGFTGWQAVQVSLRKIADALESADEND